MDLNKEGDAEFKIDIIASDTALQDTMEISDGLIVPSTFDETVVVTDHTSRNSCTETSTATQSVTDITLAAANQRNDDTETLSAVTRSDIDETAAVANQPGNDTSEILSSVTQSSIKETSVLADNARNDSAEISLSSTRCVVDEISAVAGHVENKSTDIPTAATQSIINEADHVKNNITEITSSVTCVKETISKDSHDVVANSCLPTSLLETEQSLSSIESQHCDLVPSSSTPEKDGAADVPSVAADDNKTECGRKQSDYELMYSSEPESMVQIVRLMLQESDEPVLSLATMVQLVGGEQARADVYQALVYLRKRQEIQSVGGRTSQDWMLTSRQSELAQMEKRLLNESSTRVGISPVAVALQGMKRHASADQSGIDAYPAKRQELQAAVTGTPRFKPPPSPLDMLRRNSTPTLGASSERLLPLATPGVTTELKQIDEIRDCFGIGNTRCREDSEGAPVCRDADAPVPTQIDISNPHINDGHVVATSSGTEGTGREMTESCDDSDQPACSDTVVVTAPDPSLVTAQHSLLANSNATTTIAPLMPLPNKPKTKSSFRANLHSNYTTDEKRRREEEYRKHIAETRGGASATASVGASTFSTTNKGTSTKSKLYTNSTGGPPPPPKSLVHGMTSSTSHAPTQTLHTSTATSPVSLLDLNVSRPPHGVKPLMSGSSAGAALQRNSQVGLGNRTMTSLIDSAVSGGAMSKPIKTSYGIKTKRDATGFRNNLHINAMNANERQDAAEEYSRHIAESRGSRASRQAFSVTNQGTSTKSQLYSGVGGSGGPPPPPKALIQGGFKSTQRQASSSLQSRTEALQGHVGSTVQYNQSSVLTSSRDTSFYNRNTSLQAPIAGSATNKTSVNRSNQAYDQYETPLAQASKTSFSQMNIVSNLNATSRQQPQNNNSSVTNQSSSYSAPMNRKKPTTGFRTNLHNNFSAEQRRKAEEEYRRQIAAARGGTGDVSGAAFSTTNKGTTTKSQLYPNSTSGPPPPPKALVQSRR